MSTENKTIKSSKLSYFIFLLVLILGASNYYLYQKYLSLNLAVNDVVNQGSDLDDFAKTVKRNNKLLNDNILNLQKEIQENNNKFESLEKKITNIQDSNSNPALYIKLLNVENLISNADKKLKIDKEVMVAKQLLELAQKYLQEEDDTKLVNVRKAILKKINILQEYNQSDTVPIVAALEAIEESISSLTAADLMVNKIDNSDVVKEVKKVGVQDSSLVEENISSKKWVNVVTNLKNDLLQLVKIRNIDNTQEQISQMLDNEQVNLLKLYFKIKISQTITSLNIKDITSYNKSVILIKEDIKKYFVSNIELKNKLLDKLSIADGLKQEDKLPDIGDLYTDIKLILKSSS